MKIISKLAFMAFMKLTVTATLAMFALTASAAFDSGFPGPAPSVMTLPTPNVKILGSFGSKNVPFQVLTNGYAWFTNCTFNVPYNQDIVLWVSGKSADTKATGSYWFFLNTSYDGLSSHFTTRLLNPEVQSSTTSFGTNTYFTARVRFDKSNFIGAVAAQLYLTTNAAGTINWSNVVVTANVP